MKTAKQILESMPLYHQLQARHKILKGEYNKTKTTSNILKLKLPLTCIKNIEDTSMQQNQLHKTMNATIVTGEYTDRTTGQNKKSYLTIGKLFVYNDGGMSLKLDALPSNGQPINFYDIKPKNQNNNNQAQQQPNNNYGGNGNQQNQQQGQNQNGHN